jgi:hypothetical protein
VTAHERIDVIEKSFRIFVCGLLSLIPALGLIPGVYAVFAGARLYTRHRGDWNPASSYLLWGMNVALATTAASFFIVSIAVIQLL